jgi:hypothetical protein
VDLHDFARMTKEQTIALGADVWSAVVRVLYDLVPLHFQIITR